MQKTKIEWCDSTWNPVTGCLRGCSYCYAKRIAERFGGHDDIEGNITTANVLPYADLFQPLTITRKNGETSIAPFPFGFEPTFHRYRLDEPSHKKKPQSIFVCSMGDLFGPWIPTGWIDKVMDACVAAPQHRYLFLTKYPSRYTELDDLGFLPFLPKFWYGNTATTSTEVVLPSLAWNCFISIEPLRSQMSVRAIDAIVRYQWVIIGAMTGPGKEKHLPAREWVEEIVTACQQEGTPVFMKDSLIPVWGDNLIRQFPW